MRTLFLSLLALGLAVSAAPPARAISTNEVVDIGFDVLILRPAGFATTIVGGVLFAPVALLSLPNGSAGTQQAREIFITAPVDATFRRELGDW